MEIGKVLDLNLILIPNGAKFCTGDSRGICFSKTLAHPGPLLAVFLRHMSKRCDDEIVVAVIKCERRNLATREPWLTMTHIQGANNSKRF